MNYTEKGSRSYLFSIVLVAILGGLLFGYDTAVISRTDNFVYINSLYNITSASALLSYTIEPSLYGN